MKTYPTEKIRNVALVGHGGAGKTTLAEALLFAAGEIPRVGKVEDGTTVCDFDPEEARRRISVSLSLAPLEVDGHKVNLVDTPGYADFIGDVAAALRAVDLVVCVVSAVEGVEVQTEVAWRMAEARGIPRVIFVNKLDRERASFDRTLDQLKDRFGAGVAPLELPIGEEGDFRGVIDLLTDTAMLYDGSSPEGTKGPVPADLADVEHSVHDALIEGIVVADDDLMERYLADENIESTELAHALATGIDDATVFPVLCGSAARLIGVDRLARFIVEEGPAPHVNAGEAPPVAFVFKTLVDPYVGRVNLFKVLQGTVKSDATLLNGRTVTDERLHQITTMRGKEQEPVSEVPAGDIAAVAKLSDTTTGDVLAVRGTEIDVEPLVMPTTVLSTAIHAKSKGDEDKLANALHRLEDEDPVLRLERNPETHQTLLSGMGETHLSIALERLARKFGVEVETEDVKVPYRETITGTAEAEGKLKKQTGGHGQFAIAWLRVEPTERGVRLRVRRRDRRRRDPAPVHPRGREGHPRDDRARWRARLPRGGRAGHLLRRQAPPGRQLGDGLQDRGVARLQGGAGRRRPDPARADQRAGGHRARGEPGRHHGRSEREARSHPGSSASVGSGEVEIVAMVPTSEILRYAIDLRSMTHGRGTFSVTHSHYDPVPAHVTDKITAGASA